MNTVYSGQPSFVFDYLTVEHVEQMMELQERVIASLETKSFLQPLTKEELLTILRGEGIALGVFVDEQLIAFRALLQPHEDEEHLGIDAGIPKEEWPYVYYSEVTNVHPDFRGFGLQQTLGKRLLEQVDLTQVRYICATVAPFNIASLKDKFRLGFHIVALKHKYGGQLRYIFVRSFQASFPSHTLEQEVDMSDTLQQQALLRTGWIGTAIKQRDKKWSICFQR